MKDSIKKIYQRLDEVGMDTLEKELLSGNSCISDDFKVLTDEIMKMYKEEVAIDEYLSSGKPTLTFSIKL